MKMKKFMQIHWHWLYAISNHEQGNVNHDLEQGDDVQIVACCCYRHEHNDNNNDIHAMVVVANETIVTRMMTITTRTTAMRSENKNEKQDQKEVGVLELT